VTFTYDYRNRRVRKIVETYDGGSWSEALDRKFVWYNWLLLAELDGEDDSVVKKYTWGPLAGQHGQPGSLESAGGIGGLLATRDEVLSKSYAHFYDGNGNTGQLILRGDGSTAAAYEYDAYGNVTAQTGSYADDNAWRFSTKWWDDETGLGYWGERYYDGGDGRWVNRDPIGEDGGLGLFVYAFNDALNSYDRIGREAVGGPTGPPPVGKPTSCPKNPDCSDCGQTCETAAAQNALGTDEAGVLCRTDGCRCACTNKSKLPGGPPGSPEEILKQCSLAHEQEHVRQSSRSILKSHFYPCSDNHRMMSRTTDHDECGGYAAEAGCLVGSIGKCNGAECERRVRDALFNALLQACNTHGCKAGNSPYTQWVASSLTDMQRRIVESACGKPRRPPGRSDPPIPPPRRNEPQP
jgi:RHS repeat-associated protein